MATRFVLFLSACATVVWPHVALRADARTRQLIADLADLETRRTAVVALVRKGKKVVPDLGRALATKDRNLREGVVVVLTTFGPRARKAVPAVIAALKHDDTRSRIAQAFVRIGPDTIPDLERALSRGARFSKPSPTGARSYNSKRRLRGVSRHGSSAHSTTRIVKLASKRFGHSCEVARTRYLRSSAFSGTNRVAFGPVP